MTLTLLGAVLRFPTLDVQSFWDDELFTAWIVRMPLADVISTVPGTESTPHLYYVLAWAWGKLFGTGEVGLRSLSALAGTAAVPIVYAACAPVSSRRVGLVAAALIAFNPFLVWYSQEARAYALLVPLVGLSFLFFLRALEDPRGRTLAAWAAASSSALLTHYFAALLVVPEAVWLVAKSRRRRSALLAIVAPAVTGMALLPLAVHQARSVSDPGGLGGTSLAARIAAIPKNFLVGYNGPAEAVTTAVAAALLLVAVASMPRAQLRERRLAVIAIALAVLAVGLVLSLSVVGVDYVASRNLLPALPIAAVAAGVGLAAGRWGVLATAALCALSCVILVSVALRPEYQRKDWRGAARALGPARQERAVVFSPAFSNAGPFNVYFPESHLMHSGRARLSEIAVVALASLGQFSTGAPHPPRDPSPSPPSGFRLAERDDAATYTLVRYRAPAPVRVTRSRMMRLRFPEEDAVIALQGR